MGSCRGVGLVIALIASGCTPEEPPILDGAFSLLTYNVQGLPDALSDSPRPTLDRMVDIAPLLNAYDIVGVQEDFNVDWHGALVAEAEHSISRHMTDVVEERVYSSGLALLSAVGTESAYEEVFYTDCNGVLDGASDCLASKGFQILTLEVEPGTLIDIVNTHHEAGGGEEDEAVRAIQVAQIIAATDGPRAVILMGDTNLRPSDPPDALLLAEYAAAGFVDACTVLDCDEADHIDRFLYRSGDSVALTALSWSRSVELVDDEGVDLSDHPGISMQMSWSATPETERQ